MKNSLQLDKLTYEFHVAKHIREKYELDEVFFSITGNVIFTNFHQVRIFTQKINNKRSIDDQLSPGEVNGAGLLDEIYHFAIRKYFKQNFPSAFQDAINNINESLGSEKFDSLLIDFIKIFPPQKVYKNGLTPKQYLNQKTDFVQNRELLIEELILLHISNLNPAFLKLKELFNEDYLAEKTHYKSTITNLEKFFKKEEFKIGVKNTDLFSFLKLPFQTYSLSIWEQLDFIKNEWGIFIDAELIRKIQSSKDLFIESIKFEPQFGGGGGAPTIVPKYKGKTIDADSLVLGKSRYKYAELSTKSYEEPEQFTPDTNWMPKLVLIAKNIHVWLDQLSKKYKKEIKTLDKIPIEELLLLRKWNINSLWLIGVWERSHASKRIKHIMGNIDAVASAYSLYDYEIAHDLGGEEAYKVFNQNAKSVGIRLASDMVPNHTGIYSKWIIEHPDYFIQLDYSPFPSYNYTGVNLSEHPDVEIRIEDQYWQMKDAAVVFQRKDLKTGEVKYIYHGNDGTNMPWNDTAQLDMLKAEVREAVIQKIFDVARRFSVIRFDAAMTLAKKHFSRLWYPEPGKGGDIPSRADFALTNEEFDKLFPKEFWREVVDRINEEMPETLLLAEAFWLMEGYFVRTLGMHRVYNSAFMHMMMKEENSKYRELITNTLEFEPEILKRYVNFMSNPDEETAINQFGTDDKYFGVLVMMCTLPGLPMLAHGQIEGYTEKYGMEYKRAYYNEEPKPWLVERHEREIFPIVGKRYLFAEVENFWLYDFIDQNNKVNENVFAFSNAFYGENALVIYNNKFDSTSGFINFSRQKIKNNGNSKQLNNIKFSDNFKIQNSDFYFYIFRDVTNNLEYLFNGREINNNGLWLNLHGFEYRVYLNVEELYDKSGDIYNFYKENYGKAIWNIYEKIDDMKLEPIQNSFKKLFDEKNIQKLLEIALDNDSTKNDLQKTITNIKKIYFEFLELFRDKFSFRINYDKVKFRLEEKLNNIFHFIKTNQIENEKQTSTIKKVSKLFEETNKANLMLLSVYEIILCTKEIITDKFLSDNFPANIKITNTVHQILNKYVSNEFEATRKVILLNLLLSHYKDFDELKCDFDDFIKLRSQKDLFDFIFMNNCEISKKIMDDEFTQTIIDVNEYEGVKYFSKERLENLLEEFQLLSIYKVYSEKLYTVKSKKQKKDLTLRFAKKTLLLYKYINKLAADSKFIYPEFLKYFQKEKTELTKSIK